MGKKKGKKDVEKKAALAARKEAKQEKSARKRLTKQGGNVPDDGAEELDQVLQAYKSQDKAAAVVAGETGKPSLVAMESEFPLPRANATLDSCTDEKRDYYYLFGGEYFDGVSNVVLDEMLRYETSKKEWKQVMTSPRPSPRCAHSCVSYKQSLYVFGGELATADEYHHYRDLWKFDVNTLKWTEISAKNPPSARSGHACLVWKSYMILFGGFFEALRETKWYNDIHVFNLQTETWMDVPQSRLASKPEPRSACNIASFGTDKLIIHGGFSKLKTANSAAETRVHSDAWALHLSPLLQNKPPTWERWMSSSKNVSSLSPNGRAGTASTTYKDRMLVFGGVVDKEQHHHKVESVFYNDLMALDMERRKWFPLRIKDKAPGGAGRRRRKPKDGESPEIEQEGVSAESSSSELEEEEEPEGDEVQASGWDLDMLRSNMFAFVDGDGNIVYEKIEEEEEERKEDDLDEAEEEKDEEKEESKEEEVEEKEESKGEELEEEVSGGEGGPKPFSEPSTASKKITSSSVMALNAETNTPEAVARTEPLPRINASTLVHGHTLYLFGGILEVGDREVTLDDMWSVDLRKREKWECLWEGTMHKQVWRGAVFDDDDSYVSTGKEDGSDEEFDSSDDDDDEMDGVDNPVSVKSKKSSKKSARAGLRQEIAEINAKYELDDENRTPDKGESLADFYSRTSKYWNGHAADALSGTDAELSNKEVKREGFKLAKERYDELKPVLDRLMEMMSDSREQKESRKEKSKKSSKKSSKR